MENTTFRDPIVARESQRFSMLQADVTEESTENTELLEEFGVSGVPTIIFYDASGRERKRLVGYVSAKQMLEMMQSIPSRPTAPAPEFRERRQPTTELIPTATEKTDAEIVVAQ